MNAFADRGIDIGAGSSGEVRTTCPTCSASRRKSNIRCLVVNVEAGCWYCHHCAWSGGLARGETRLDSAAVERLQRRAKCEHNARYRSNRPRVEALWKSGSPIQPGDAASLYLKRRGLVLDQFPTDLRYVSRLPYFDQDGVHLGDLPAMLAAVRDTGGELIAVHRTYLSKDGGKAVVDPVKKLSMTCGPVSGASIRLTPTRGSTIGVAEGIETALAASLGSRTPVWSTVSAHGLQSFKWPADVRKLIVFGDHDANDTGQRAAELLAKRAKSAGLSVQVLIPSEPGSDWADVWARRETEAA